jgi:hypothetical protein
MDDQILTLAGKIFVAFLEGFMQGGGETLSYYSMQL